MSDFKPDIWRLQAQFDTKGLVEALNNDDSSIRKRAAAALRALGAIATIPQLRQRLEEERDPDTRAHIVAALDSLEEEQKRQTSDAYEESLHDETAIVNTEVHRMVQQLKSDDENAVIEAARKLGDLKDKQAVEPLVVLFKDTSLSVKVRLAIAEALLELESALVEIALLGALRKPDWRVRRNGAAILGQLKADWAIVPLSKALRDNHEKVRRTAYAALRYIGTPESLATIEAIKKSRKTTVSTAKLLSQAPEAENEEVTITTVEPHQEAPLEQVAPTEEASPEKVLSEDPTPELIQRPTDDVAGNPVLESTDSTVIEIQETPSANNESDEDDKIAWPKRNTEARSNLAPTRPLDPKTLEEARARFEQLKQDEPEDNT